MAEIANLNGVSIDPDTITGFNKDYLEPVTGSDGVTLPAFMAQIWAIYKAALGVVAATWRVGVGVPSNALGIDGDFYLSTAGNVFVKVAGAYVFQTNLAGPAGSGSSIHASQNGTGITVAPRSRLNFINLTVADNAGADRVDVTAPPAALSRIPRTSNTQITAANNEAWIDITSGSFTQTFQTAASLGAGFSCYVSNNGTGEITVTSDGVTNWIMWPGEFRLFQSDGTTLRSAPFRSAVALISTSRSILAPPGMASMDCVIVGASGGSGGGGGGGGGSVGALRGGGGGGSGAHGGFGRIKRYSRTITAGETLAAVIGAGGSGGAFGAGGASNANGLAGSPGTAGGATTFDSVTADGGSFGNGGSFGTSGSNAGSGGNGGTAASAPAGVSTSGNNRLVYAEAALAGAAGSVGGFTASSPGGVGGAPVPAAGIALLPSTIYAPPAGGSGGEGGVQAGSAPGANGTAGATGASGIVVVRFIP